MVACGGDAGGGVVGVGGVLGALGAWAERRFSLASRSRRVRNCGVAPLLPVKFAAVLLFAEFDVEPWLGLLPALWLADAEC